MTVDAPLAVESPADGRHRPLGILVVVALGVGRIIIELAQLVAVDPTGILALIVGGSTIPSFEGGTPAWLLGRIGIILLVGLTVASVVGLWRLRTWGWSLALIISGAILLFDIGWWMIGQPRYPGMFMNMVAVLYLNQRDVRAIFLPSSL